MICSRCGIDYPDATFTKWSRRCRDCIKNREKEYYLSHKTEKAIRWKEYYVKNKKRLAEYDRNRPNRAKRLEQQRQHKKLNRPAVTATERRWRQANVDRHRQRDYNLAKYGISQVEYLRMVEQQGGKCAVCRLIPTGKKPNGILHIDHCHVSGKIRALLCNKCNTALGLLRDDPEIATRAATYLRKHKP